MKKQKANYLWVVFARVVMLALVFAAFAFNFYVHCVILPCFGIGSGSSSVTGNGEVNKNARGIGSVGAGNVDENCFKGVCIETKGE